MFRVPSVQQRWQAVVFGAVAGATLRWAATELVGPSRVGWALLAVNAIGSVVLGFVMTTPSTPRRDLVGPGLCGALTTWSGLALFAAELIRDERQVVALSWVAAHVVVGVMAAAGGHLLGERSTSTSTATT